MPAEIVSHSKEWCSGANPKSQLIRQELVTIEVTQSGSKKVICPYLLPVVLLNKAGQREDPVFRCRASALGALDPLEEIEEAMTMPYPRDIQIENYVKKFPFCKYLPDFY